MPHLDACGSWIRTNGADSRALTDTRISSSRRAGMITFGANRAGLLGAEPHPLLGHTRRQRGQRRRRRRPGPPPDCRRATMPAHQRITGPQPAKPEGLGDTAHHGTSSNRRCAAAWGSVGPLTGSIVAGPRRPRDDEHHRTAQRRQPGRRGAASTSGWSDSRRPPGPHQGGMRRRDVGVDPVAPVDHDLCHRDPRRRAAPIRVR